MRGGACCAHLGVGQQPVNPTPLETYVRIVLSQNQMVSGSPNFCLTACTTRPMGTARKIPTDSNPISFPIDADLQPRVVMEQQTNPSTSEIDGVVTSCW